MAEEAGQTGATQQRRGTGEKAAVRSEIEAKARKAGWLPESEWSGAPPRYGFVDAQTFLERGETIVPILSARLKGARHALESLRTSSAKANRFMADANARALKERDWVLAELERILEKASVLAGRTAFALANAKIHDLKPASPAAKQRPSLEVQRFLRENEWYSTDPDLRAFADEYAEILKESGMSGRPMLAKVAQRTRVTFAHMFEERRSTASAGAQRRRPESPQQKYDDLPDTAKAACDAFIADGIMTQEEYVKNYRWD